MKKKAFLSAMLLAGSMLFAVPPSAHAGASDCVDGVTAPLPWDRYNCAPLGTLVDCTVCTVTAETP